MSSGRIRILADTGYAAALSGCDLLQDEIQRRFGSRLARLAKLSLIRGVLGWWIAREYDFVVTVAHWPGGRWLVFLTAWLGGGRRRKLILLEFISCPERLLNRLLFAVWLPLMFRPAIRRTLVAAQVMAPAEPQLYAEQFRLPASLFHLIRLPLLEQHFEDRQYDPADDLVFASGRAACDWETLFRAAEGSGWNLSVVTSKHDRRTVDRLNRGRVACVRSEVPYSEHAELMAKAAVYVMPLRERPISVGQLRIRHAITAGTPVVCTRVGGLDGYAIDGQTASVVEEGDYQALRREVNNLLRDLEWRRTLATRAREYSRSRDAAQFGREIDNFVHRVANNTFLESGMCSPKSMFGHDTENPRLDRGADGNFDEGTKHCNRDVHEL